MEEKVKEYLALGGDRTKADFFLKFASYSFAQEKIERELLSLKDAAEQKGHPLHKAQDWADMPPQAQKVSAEAKELFKDTVYLHHSLYALGTDEERLKAAVEIDDNFQELGKMWDALDDYAETGVWNPLKDESGLDLQSVDVNALTKRKNTLRTYISKLKNREDEKGKNKLYGYKKELEKVEKALDAV